MAKKEDIINIVKIEGNTGTSANEKYVTIHDTIIDEAYGEVGQLCYFSDTDEFLAYMLSDNNDGQFVGYDDLSCKTKQAIENLTMWD